MAAEALASSVLRNLATGAIDQFWRVLGVGSNLRKLESALSAIQAVIQDAEVRSVTEIDVQDWVAKLKDAAYDADDLLDEFQTYANQDTSMSDKVRIFFSRFNPLAFRIKMSFKIKPIVEKLDMIAQERSRYQLREDPRQENKRTAAVIDETTVYGRDDDVEKIVKLLLEKETDKEEDLPVVTIVGMGGLGKTTLAQLVYKHERVVKQESFDSRIWVYVSDKFDIKRIATPIIEFATEERCDLSELAQVVNRVQQILAEKRFLLVLDDVWISFLDEDSSRDDGSGFYKMHDLVHDLAKSVAGDEHFICYADADQKATISPRCRFCTLVGTLEESELKVLVRE